jgi:hypothetical protein
MPRKGANIGHLIVFREKNSNLVSQFEFSFQIYEGEKRYSPAECLGTKTRTITGNPGKKYISTYYFIEN